MHITQRNAQGVTPLNIVRFAKTGILKRKLARAARADAGAVLGRIRAEALRNPRVKLVELYAVELPNGKCVWATNIPQAGGKKVSRSRSVWGTQANPQHVPKRTLTIPAHVRIRLRHIGDENLATVSNIQSLH